MSQTTDMTRPMGDGIHVPLRVPIPRWKIALLCGIPTLLFTLIFGAFAAAFAFDPSFQPKSNGGKPLTQNGRYGVAAMALIPPAVFLTVLVVSLVSPFPGLEVRPDGLRITSRRRCPKGGTTEYGSGRGLYLWSEVESSHWLRYEPGKLSVRLRKADAMGSELFGKEPAFVWCYRVPGAYRAAVEAALRAHGKWQDGGSSPPAPA